MNICRIFRLSASELCKKEIAFPTLNFYRNTWIVKRRYKPPLSRKTAERPRILKGKHFIYDTIARLDEIPQPDLHIVLTTFVEGIGDVGDVISVMPEYARDYLLLPRKAVYATPENIEKFSKMKMSRGERPKFSSIHAATIIRSLSKITIPVFMNSENPWTITKNHLHIAFRKEGFHVPCDAIELPSNSIEGPDLAMEGRDFAVTVTINNTEKIPVRCRIFYFKKGMETALLSEVDYLEKNEPVLAEQKELLESMLTPEIIDDPSSQVSLVEKYRIKYIE